MKIAINTFVLLSLLYTLNSCSLTTAAGITSGGQPTKEVTENLTSTTANSAVNLDHGEWNTLLKKYVNKEGFVDYKGFQSERKALDSYLTKLSSFDPNNEWSTQELLAYYINLYNAYTVDLILDNYPTKSIKDISGAFTKAFIPIGNRNLSLGGVENGVLRKMNEPRIHFAINCASYSCPKLLNEAFTASKINEQLERVTVEFINSDKNDLNPTNPKFSKIFDFYTKDFKVNGEPDLIGYVNQYAKTKVNSNAPINFKEYDWNLNEQK
ncbi:DUF547 domain-containing protein [Ulvibacter antarcticus]|uniref:Uncharacterized protein DUF547 n=1 Tax=Ulvibacter antarcticus TaxID=442714 RepID=A0A3L9Z0T3_9FLAO|nr:DUF547 domain-containing protein [Ulvibacter antarcticus]RMA66463.1 uncharacterized protein DUF547 [Ulvibacter antarcticus]